MRTNADVTVYVKSVNATSRSEQYSRTQIRGVVWEDRRAVSIGKNGELKLDGVVVYIALAKCQITIKADDVIVRGLVSDDITTAFTIADLKRKYRDSATVRSCDRMDAGSISLRHYQVGAM